MFGGIGFMLNGNMVALVSKRGLLLRVGKDRHRHVLALPEARPVEIRGRPMEGYVYVDPLIPDNGALKTWLGEASTFVKTLPPKTADRKSARKGKQK
jgi:TfoX/Sxy family transcriptional regulator of competence genes